METKLQYMNRLHPTITDYDIAIVKKFLDDEHLQRIITECLIVIYNKLVDRNIKKVLLLNCSNNPDIHHAIYELLDFRNILCYHDRNTENLINESCLKQKLSESQGMIIINKNIEYTPTIKELINIAKYNSRHLFNLFFDDI